MDMNYKNFSCISEFWYEKIRGLSDFTVDQTEVIRTNYNQYAVVYTFSDLSQFIIYHNSWSRAWRNSEGIMMGRRNV
jgi:hypothetical protein